MSGTTTMRYKRCMRNWALVHEFLFTAGSVPVHDGCQLFVSQEGNMVCDACGCHRNFHEVEPISEEMIDVAKSIQTIFHTNNRTVDSEVSLSIPNVRDKSVPRIASDGNETISTPIAPQASQIMISPSPVSQGSISPSVTSQSTPSIAPQTCQSMQSSSSQISQIAVSPPILSQNSQGIIAVPISSTTPSQTSQITLSAQNPSQSSQGATSETPSQASQVATSSLILSQISQSALLRTSSQAPQITTTEPITSQIFQKALSKPIPSQNSQNTMSSPTTSQSTSSTPFMSETSESNISAQIPPQTFQSIPSTPTGSKVMTALPITLSTRNSPLTVQTHGDASSTQCDANDEKSQIQVHSEGVQSVETLNPVTPEAFITRDGCTQSQFVESIEKHSYEAQSTNKFSDYIAGEIVDVQKDASDTINKLIIRKRPREAHVSVPTVHTNSEKSKNAYDDSVSSLPSMSEEFASNAFRAVVEESVAWTNGVSESRELKENRSSMNLRSNSDPSGLKAVHSTPQSPAPILAESEDMLDYIDVLSQYLSKYPEHTKYSTYEIKESDESLKKRRTSLDHGKTGKIRRSYKIVCGLCAEEIDMDKQLRNLRAHLGGLGHRILVKKIEHEAPIDSVSNQIILPFSVSQTSSLVGESLERIEDDYFFVFEADLIGRKVFGIGELLFAKVVQMEQHFDTIHDFSRNLFSKAGFLTFSKVCQLFLLEKDPSSQSWKIGSEVSFSKLLPVSERRAYFVRMCTTRLFGVYENSQGICPPPPLSIRPSKATAHHTSSSTTIIILIKLVIANGKTVGKIDSLETLRSFLPPIYVGSIECDDTVTFSGVSGYFRIMFKLKPTSKISVCAEKADFFAVQETDDYLTLKECGIVNGDTLWCCVSDVDIFQLNPEQIPSSHPQLLESNHVKTVQLLDSHNNVIPESNFMVDELHTPV